MPQFYKSKPVLVVREAHQNDPGFDVEGSKQKPAVDAIPQDLIRLEDGTQKVVFRNELKKDLPPVPAARTGTAPVTTKAGAVQKWKGQTVSVSPAIYGDSTNVVVKLADGSTKTVPKREVYLTYPPKK